MTDEMRVALVAVALSEGMRVDQAFELVGGIEANGLTLPELVERVRLAAVDNTYAHRF